MDISVGRICIQSHFHLLPGARPATCGYSPLQKLSANKTELARIMPEKQYQPSMRPPSTFPAISQPHAHRYAGRGRAVLAQSERLLPCSRGDHLAARCHENRRT